MSSISGLGANSYNYVPVNYPQTNNANIQSGNTSATQKSTSVAGQSVNPSGTMATNNTVNSVTNPQIPLNIASALYNQEQTASTLLDALNNNSGSSSDSMLGDILKLSPELDMLKNGVNPFALDNSAVTAPQTGATTASDNQSNSQASQDTTGGSAAATAAVVSSLANPVTYNYDPTTGLSVASNSNDTNQSLFDSYV